MGYTTEQIHIVLAKSLAVPSTGEIVSASKESYFDDYSWKHEVVSAEIRDDHKTIDFTLANGDFVEFKRNFRRLYPK